MVWYRFRRGGTPMPRSARRIDDETIQILAQLAEISAAPAKLTDALRKCSPVTAPNSVRNAQQSIARLSRELAGFVGSEICLLDTREKQGSFATGACRALQPALTEILRDRQAALERDRLTVQLEWLRLSTCLDGAPLRIGAYQAHAERFLAAALNLLITNFPWLDCRLHIEEARARTDRYTGRLKERFDDGEFDYILVPRESEKSHLQRVYTYSFRVVGHPDRLDQLRTGNNTVNVRDITGMPLIVAPEGASSRRRLHDIFLDEGIDIDADAVSVLEEENPVVMRMRAETGQGIAVMSDEYSVIGGSRMGFPYLVRGAPAERCQVEMGLLKSPRADEPRHHAFDFVVQQLVEQEAEHDRAAAQA
jgi:hypothetical protein